MRRSSRWVGAPRLLLPLLLGLAFACKEGGGLTYPTVAAQGRPAGCPERAVTVGGPGGYPTPDAIACSYADAKGKGESKVRGSVYGEQPGTFPGLPLEGVLVTVHELSEGRSPGDQLARARTDAQGHFTLAAMLPSGTYLVVARDDAGSQLARALLTTDDRNVQTAPVQLLVPMDPALKAAVRGGDTKGGDAAADDGSEAGATRPVGEGDADALQLAPRAVGQPEPAKVEASEATTSTPAAPKALGRDEMQ